MSARSSRPSESDGSRSGDRLTVILAVAKWVIVGGIVIFGCIAAVGEFGLDPFWSSLLGLAIAFAIIVWHMPGRVKR